MSNNLKHHGVEGQKWGVRNGPPYPLKISRQAGKRMNKKGYTLRKGTHLYRTTGNDNETNNHESMFASFSEQDRNIYNRRLVVNMVNPNATVFDMTMKLKEDLVVPSQKERVDAFIKYMSTGENAKKFDQYLKNVMSDNKDLYNYASHQVNAKNFYGYLSFCAITNGVNRTSKGEEAARASEKIKQDYYSILKSKGYNATVDDLDAVDSLMGNNPIVVFDRGKTVEVIEVKRVNGG